MLGAYRTSDLHDDVAAGLELVAVGEVDEGVLGERCGCEGEGSELHFDTDTNGCLDFLIAEVQAGDPFIKQFRPFSWKLSETSMGL